VPTDTREADVGIHAVDAMRASFASSDFAPVVLKFFDALAALLTGGRRKQ
jgi:hypothetical protein